MLQHADETASQLRERYSQLFFQTKFTRLPDEIFSLIIEFAGQEDIKSTVRISWTCRRFRELALGNPRLWTYSSCLQMEGVEALAARSRGLDLTLGTHYMFPDRLHETDPQIPHLFSVLSFAVLHSARLVELQVHLSVINLRRVSDETLSEYTSLSFPALRTLRVSDTYYVGGTLFENWDMPSLRSLELNNSTRSSFPTLRPEVLANLTSLQTEAICQSPDTMASFLSRCPSLMSLQMEVARGSCQGILYDPYFYEELPLVSLPTVTSLTVNFTDGCEAGFVESVLRFFECPNLRSFSVFVGAQYFGHPQEENPDTMLVESISKTMLIAQHTLKELSITLEAREAYRTLGELCFQLPLARLSIMAPVHVEPDTYPPERKRSLARVKLGNCEGLDIREIMVKLSSWKRGPNDSPESCLVLDGKDKNGSIAELFADAEVYESYEPYRFQWEAVSAYGFDVDIQLG